MRPRPTRLLDPREFPVLYVDDEPENLRIFELTFRREFSVVTARSGEEGLQQIHQKPVALVLSDHRMPGMSGVEFLTRIREIDPKTIRILVTAYGDAETLRAAINDGRIYRFVPKPWVPDEMAVTLRRGVEFYALDREREALLSELTLLNRVSQSISQELDFAPLMDLMLEAVCGDLGFDGAGILLLDAAGERFTWAGTSPKDDEVAAHLRSHAIGRAEAPGFVERLCAGEAQLLSADQALEFEAPVREWATEVAAGQILVLPLVAKKGVIGALAVDNRSGGRSFDVDDRTLLEGFASQAAIAVENARLVEALRRSREQVLRADRLKTLGTLSAGLAHEINNPLVSIQTFLTLAPEKRDSNDAEFWDAYHSLALREVKRIRGLVASMGSLTRGSGDGGDASPEQFDPGELAREVAALLEREAGSVEVALSVEVDPQTPKIVAVRDQLHQVLLNLVLNGVQATPPGGRVSLRTAPDPERGAGWLSIEVTDSGSGIREEDLERIFDPFFTTRNPDEGTGLGLMICHRIVTEHGGAIEVRSREGEGSTFRVRLPIEGGDSRTAKPESG